MANEKNLRPIRSKNEAREKGRKGGIKSGEVRRKKRDAKAAARLILNLPVSSNAIESNLKSMNVDEADFTNRVALFARAYMKAMTGDVKAMQFIIEMAGESPEFQLEEDRFKNEVGQQEGRNNAVDDWVNSIPDIGDEEEESDGNEQSDKKM